MELALNLAELEILCDNFIKKSGQDFLTDSEFKVMLMLRVYGECAPKILIGKIGLLKTNLALVLKNLSKENLVSYRKNVQDGRGKVYALTEKGQDLIDAVVKNIDERLQDIATEDFFYALKIVLSVLNKKI